MCPSVKSIWLMMRHALNHAALSYRPISNQDKWAALEASYFLCWPPLTVKRHAPVQIQKVCCQNGPSRHAILSENPTINVKYWFLFIKSSHKPSTHVAFTLKSLSETFIAINRNWLVGKCDCVNSEVCVCVCDNGFRRAVWKLRCTTGITARMSRFSF